jgi:ribosomal protein S18 acetylase RimI-like enzyme
VALAWSQLPRTLLPHDRLSGGLLDSVRKATSADACGIIACLSAAFEVYRDSYTAAAFADTILTPETIERRFQEMTVFVATGKSGEIVGTIACSAVHAGEGHIRGMAIRPTAQGSGIAAQLLAHAEAHFRQRNCKRISLDTTAPLARAIRFYEKSGSLRRGRSRTSLVWLCTNTSKPFNSVRPL